MAALPSYQEATSRPDWLRLTAPYVRFDDYRSLCLVSRRSWRIFAPCLWADLLRAVRRAGLDPGDDLAWWFDFVFNKLDRVAPSTRGLVRVLDVRDFGKDAYHFASDNDAGALGKSFMRALELLPNTDSILLDGHADLDPAFLKLVYLDVSEVPGSLQPLLQPGVLPDLRVLKLRLREVDDTMLEALVSKFRLRLWSLDLTGNKVTDTAIQILGTLAIPRDTFHSDGQFRVEGRVRVLSHGTPDYGQFLTIQESESSSFFTHEERYFIDAPAYVADSGRQETGRIRSDGAIHLRRDSADYSVRILSKDESDLEMNEYCQLGGITHLSLSDTRISSFGIQKLLRISSGHLGELTCNTMPLLPLSMPVSGLWPKSANLRGILGAAHLLRPTYSCQLRRVTIHHSLVTNVPTLDMDGLSEIARDFLAETAVLERVDEAYPQVFVPDMNPRLTSLTLTGIPRRSSGPLLERLIKFLELLSRQERDIQDASAVAPPWRGPSMLQGLRHVALEFEPDAMDDEFSATEDLDAEELMDVGDTGFSFFNDTSAGERRRSAAAVGTPAADTSHSEAVPTGTHPSGAEDAKNFIKYDGTWNGEIFSLPVWVGPTPGANKVLGEYRRLVMTAGLRDGVGPVTPGQILAGAPEDSYVFHTAWCAAVMPRQLRPPTRDMLAGMKDVLAGLRAYRLTGRANYAELQRKATRGSHVPLGEPHFFWTGTLKVSTPMREPDARSARYWH
ncbi:leucine rich repeat domain-containing protein [Purpureocillium lavendulum]|uniref:Leucine rich repeat domain-containing protein n=1 Tax=Purpureocillium lavendulum TaxID=1247861 RepID=A0AB34FM46_9HYPO|nr:leucine rich repeat domain-containing protein [Purpureocillium lavendulum]